MMTINAAVHFSRERNMARLTPWMSRFTTSGATVETSRPVARPIAAHVVAFAQEVVTAAEPASAGNGSPMNATVGSSPRRTNRCRSRSRPR